MTTPAVLITGAPGVGKSSVAREIALRARLGAHVEADALQLMIVSGGQWPSAGTEESYRQLLLRTTNVAAVASNFRSCGFIPVLDEVIATSEQLEIVEVHIPPPHLTIIALTSNAEVILERDAGRAKHTAANYPGAEEMVLRAVRGRAAVIDAAQLTLGETVHAVLNVLPWAPSEGGECDA